MDQTEISRSYEGTSDSFGDRMAQWLNDPFPYYLNDERKNLLLILGISGFVTAFLYLFKTDSDFPAIPQSLAWVHGLIVCGALLLNIILLPRLLQSWMDPTAWTVKKYIFHNLWHLVVIAVMATVVEKVFFCPQEPWTVIASHVMVQVPLKGLIPIALTTLFLRAHLLQQNLQEAIRTNQELQQIKTLKNESPKGNNQITLYSDTSEQLTFHLPDLLYIEADDNYSTVVWTQNGGLQKKLLRVNLKNIESQLNNSYTFRCHRSYIVNINAIAAISGNANGYKLKIQQSDTVIPVSRPKGKEIMQKISQLKNLMELS